jgi:uncharacterized damage-inducible protein DinB
MDLLDRFLGHDTWTTRRLLLYCRELTPEQLHRRFDIGHETLQETLVHMIRNIEVWTDLIYERPVQPYPEPREITDTIDGLIQRLDRAAADFAAIARKLTDEGRLDDYWTDVLDDPPTQKTYGGAIVHLITHSMHHRGEVLHMLQRLGVPNLIEGDALSWEQQARR